MKNMFPALFLAMGLVGAVAASVGLARAIHQVPKYPSDQATYAAWTRLDAGEKLTIEEFTILRRTGLLVPRKKGSEQ